RPFAFYDTHARQPFQGLASCGWTMRSRANQASHLIPLRGECAQNVTANKACRTSKKDGHAITSLNMRSVGRRYAHDPTGRGSAQLRSRSPALHPDHAKRPNLPLPPELVGCARLTHRA